MSETITVPNINDLYRGVENVTIISDHLSELFANGLKEERKIQLLRDLGKSIVLAEGKRTSLEYFFDKERPCSKMEQSYSRLGRQIEKCIEFLDEIKRLQVLKLIPFLIHPDSDSAVPNTKERDSKIEFFNVELIQFVNRHVSVNGEFQQYFDHRGKLKELEILVSEVLVNFGGQKKERIRVLLEELKVL